MVSTSAPNSATTEQLVEGLSAPDSARVLDALAYATEAYGDKQTFAGRSALEFAIGEGKRGPVTAAIQAEATKMVPLPEPRPVIAPVSTKPQQRQLRRYRTIR